MILEDKLELNGTLSGHMMPTQSLTPNYNGFPSGGEKEKSIDQIKAEILTLGFDHIYALPQTWNPKMDLIVSLMNNATTNAFWSAGLGFPEWIGLTVSPTPCMY